MIPELVTSLDDGAVAPDGSLRAALHYTTHPSTATITEIIPLRIAGPFEPDNRARILRAVAEWTLWYREFWDERYHRLDEYLEELQG